MGLDMYFRKKTYVKNWGHTPKEKEFEIDIKRGGSPCVFIKPERIEVIVEKVGYWRKFNALHQWFVDNVQKGVDDCGEYYVPIEKIEELIDVLKEVRDNPSTADETLPTQAGFFFGNTDYDEYYYQEVNETIELLERLLQEDDENEALIDYYYSSSW